MKRKTALTERRVCRLCTEECKTGRSAENGRPRREHRAALSMFLLLDRITVSLSSGRSWTEARMDTGPRRHVEELEQRERRLGYEEALRCPAVPGDGVSLLVSARRRPHRQLVILHTTICTGAPSAADGVSATRPSPNTGRTLRRRAIRSRCWTRGMPRGDSTTSALAGTRSVHERGGL